MRQGGRDRSARGRAAGPTMAHDARGPHERTVTEGAYVHADGGVLTGDRQRSAPERRGRLMAEVLTGAQPRRVGERMLDADPSLRGERILVPFRRGAGAAGTQTRVGAKQVGSAQAPRAHAEGLCVADGERGAERIGETSGAGHSPTVPASPPGVGGYPQAALAQEDGWRSRIGRLRSHSCRPGRTFGGMSMPERAETAT